MIKMLKTYFLKDKLIFFLPWDLYSLFDDKFVQFDFKFELIQFFLNPKPL
jgi:hypothetical protein